MEFINFRKQISTYPVFSLKEIKKNIPNFNRIQIDRWEKKGYLIKIKQGFYALVDRNINQYFLFFTANKIYQPSYISLEKALKFYNLIPEEVFQITSVSSKKTNNFKTSIGNFNYNHISPSLFWGYRLIISEEYKIIIADPEKAILDYLYLHVNLKTTNDFKELRINIDSFYEKINLDKFNTYLEAFGNKALSKRANIFLNTIQND